MDVKRRKSVIKSLGRFNYHAERKQEFHKAFVVIMGRYLGSRILAPVVSSNPDPLAKRIRWNPNSAVFCVDVERAVTKALKDRPELLKEWAKYYVVQAAYGIQPMHLSQSQARQHAEIELRCGREFIRLAMYPLWRYFRPRSEKRLRELEQMYREEQLAA